MPTALPTRAAGSTLIVAELLEAAQSLHLTDRVTIDGAPIFSIAPTAMGLDILLDDGQWVTDQDEDALSNAEAALKEAEDELSELQGVERDRDTLQVCIDDVLQYLDEEAEPSWRVKEALRILKGNAA